MTSRNRAGDANRHVALCYIRQSYTRDANDTNSPQRQRANIQAVCDRYGWTPEWYVDAEGHKSGRNEKNRPSWLALKARLGDPDVVALVANDLARLHRKSWHVGRTMEILKWHGCVALQPLDGDCLVMQHPELSLISIDVEHDALLRVLPTDGVGVLVDHHADAAHTRGA